MTTFQSIPDGQNQVVPYIFSCSRSHLTLIYATIGKKRFPDDSHFLTTLKV